MSDHARSRVNGAHDPKPRRPRPHAGARAKFKLALMAGAALLASVVSQQVTAQIAGASVSAAAGRQLLLNNPVIIAALATIGPEIITYGYDAKGRLVRLVRDGPVNDVTTTYQFDRADNRTRLTTTGSPNPPQP